MTDPITATRNATLTFHDARNPQLLSYSGISLYQTCRYKWRMQLVYGIKSTERFRPLEVGSAVHAGLEHYLTERGTFQAGIDAWEDDQTQGIPYDVPGVSETLAQIAEYAADAKLIARRVVEEINARGLVTVRDADGPIVERELIIPIEGWEGFACHIDWVAYDPNERTYWIVDFKTRKTFHDDASEDVNLQNPVYQYVAAECLNLPIAGTLTFQVRSTVPKRPKVNKDGTVSRAKIVTDWATYRAVVVEQGQDPEDYRDMQAYLNETEWTSVLKAYRSADTVNRMWHRIVRPVAVEMAVARNELQARSQLRRKIGANKTPRTLSQRTCNGCGIRDICLSALRGWDVASLLEQADTRDDAWKTALADETL